MGGPVFRGRGRGLQLSERWAALGVYEAARRGGPGVVVSVVLFSANNKSHGGKLCLGLNAIGCLLDPPSHSGPPRVRSGKPPNRPWEGDPSSAFLTLDTLDRLFVRN